MSDPLDTDAGRAVVEAAARAHHEAYERLAAEFGWTTQQTTRVEWDNLPDANRQLMLAAEREALLAALAVRTREPCPICERRFDNLVGQMIGAGVPKVPGHTVGSGWDWVPCPRCEDGTVPGVPALVELLMERCGWRDATGKLQRSDGRGGTWTAAPPIEPVYRLRGET